MHVFYPFQCAQVVEEEVNRKQHHAGTDDAGRNNSNELVTAEGEHPENDSSTGNGHDNLLLSERVLG